MTQRTTGILSPYEDFVAQVSKPVSPISKSAGVESFNRMGLLGRLQVRKPAIQQARRPALLFVAATPLRLCVSASNPRYSWLNDFERLSRRPKFQSPKAYK